MSPHADSPHQQRVESSSPARSGKQYWNWFWLALVLAPLPMFGHYLVWNWQYEHYHFFPLLLIAVTGLAYKRFDGRFAPPRGWTSWGAIVLAVISVVGSLRWDTPWLATIAFVLFASALLASLSGPADASLFGLSLPLWLLVRLPLGYDQLLILWLQTITTGLTSVVLDVVRVPHAVTGNVIQLADRELFVAEACSGIQSVFTLAFIASLLVAIHRRPVFMLPLYLVVSCVLAVAANVLRVSTVAISQSWFDLDLASGWPHEVVGYVALAIGIGLLLSFDHLLVAMIHPLGDADEGEAFNPLIIGWNWMTSTTVASSDSVSGSINERFFGGRSIQTVALVAISSIAVLLFFASVGVAVTRQLPDAQNLGMYASGGPLVEPKEDLFANSLSVLRVTDHVVVRNGENPRLGENADVWTVEIAGRQAQLVLSQTYTSWHEFCFCYQIDGWKLLNREIDQTSDDETQLPIVSALFSGDKGQMGQLVYAGIDAGGNAVNPPAMAGRLSTRFDPVPEDVQNVVMLQLWVTGNEKLDARLFSDVKADFAKAVAIVSSELRKQVGVIPAEQTNSMSLSADESSSADEVVE